VIRHDLDVVVIPSPVRFLVLDAEVWEMDFVIEVRQVVFEGPLVDFLGGAIGMTVVVRMVAIALVKPPLVLTFEFVVEDDSLDARAARLEALSVAFVGTMDLDVVFKLALAFDTVVERLTAARLAVSVMLEQAAASLGQRNHVLTVARHANGLDEPLLTEVAEVTGTWIDRAIVMVAEVTTGDHSKRADRGQRARLRPPQRVFAVAVAHELAFRSARQVQMSGEHLTRVGVARASFAITLRPAGIVSNITAALGGVRGA